MNDTNNEPRPVARPGTGRGPQGSGIWVNLVGGLTILATGIVFWLDHLDRLNASDYLRWWPAVLIAYGVAHLPQRRWIAAAIFIVIGLAAMPPVPFIPDVRLGKVLGLWPLLISAGGVTLILQVLTPSPKDAGGPGSFKAVSFMGGSARTVGASEFVGGDAVAVMGACEVSVVSTTAREALVDVLAFWGGIEIRVPHGWKVENRVTAILGGYADRTSPAQDGAPRVIVRGAAIMGGVEVRNLKDAV